MQADGVAGVDGDVALGDLVEAAGGAHCLQFLPQDGVIDVARIGVGLVALTAEGEVLLDRVRAKYRVAFLSNSNEVHAEVIPKQFASIFRRDDRFIFSHRFKVAKPDPEIFRRTLEVIGALPQHLVFIDDLLENVIAARDVGIRSWQFIDAERLTAELEIEGLI